MQRNPISSSLYPSAKSSAWVAVGFLDCVGIARGFGIVLHCVSIWFAFGEGKEALARRCDGVTGIANEYSGLYNVDPWAVWCTALEWSQMYTECVRSRLHMDVGIAPGLQYDCGLQVVLGLCLLWLHCDVEIRIAGGITWWWKIDRVCVLHRDCRITMDWQTFAILFLVPIILPLILPLELWWDCMEIWGLD